MKVVKGYFCKKCNQYFKLPFYCIHKYNPEAPIIEKSMINLKDINFGLNI